jgi:alpha-beta hydrolase superfamily lysophospholipase
MSASPDFPGLPDGWHETTGFLPDSEAKIFYRLYQNKNPRTGRFLFITHGIGEQSDRFAHFPHYIGTAVDAIGLIDLPGHGKSSGTRGHVENFDDFTRPLIAAFNFLKAQVPFCREHHWMGASMGGLITLRTMINHRNLPLASVIVSEPQLGIAVQIPWIKEFFGVLLEPIIGRIPLKNEIDLATLSHDVSVQKTYAENKLNHPYASPRLYVNMKKEMAGLLKYSEKFPYNLLMLVPLADKIVDWKKSFEFFNRLEMVAGRKKEMTTFPNFFHEIFNEIGKERPFTALENWLNRP